MLELKGFLFDLPYWTTLKLPHNLDVMHMEKNICKILIGTLLKIAEKTKDTINVRVDLEEIGIRPHLHMLNTTEEESCKMPEAPYTMGKKN